MPCCFDLTTLTALHRSTPLRIDKLRNQFTATHGRLQLAEAEIEDLYVLAYDRPAAKEQRVNGGERDYALDTHGDPRARQLLRDGASILDATMADISAWCDAVRAFMADGEIAARRKPFTVTANETADAIAAQSRRRRRGEYTPRRTYPQNVDQIIAENRQLRKRIEELERKAAS